MSGRYKNNWTDSTPGTQEFSSKQKKPCKHRVIHYTVTNAKIKHAKGLEVAINAICMEGRGTGREIFKDAPSTPECEAMAACWRGSTMLGPAHGASYLISSYKLVGKNSWMFSTQFSLDARNQFQCTTGQWCLGSNQEEGIPGGTNRLYTTTEK